MTGRQRATAFLRKRRYSNRKLLGPDPGDLDAQLRASCGGKEEKRTADAAAGTDDVVATVLHSMRLARSIDSRMKVPFTETREDEW